MQRRAAAVSVVFFLVVSAASYGLIATAEEPTVGFEDPEYSLSTGQSFELEGQEYTVTEINPGDDGDPTDRTGTIAWTIEEADYSETWDNGSTVTIDERDWTVVIESGEEPSAFTLREDLDREAILGEDPDADNETWTDSDGDEYVVLRRDGDRELVPVEEYFDPEERTYETGDQLTYDGQQVTVDTVTADAVTVAWTAPREESVSLNHLSNVTIGDQTYLVYFASDDTVYLTQQFDEYDRQLAEIDRYERHVNGLWGVNILSGLAAFALLGMAYLPSRY